MTPLSSFSSPSAESSPDPFLSPSPSIFDLPLPDIPPSDTSLLDTPSANTPPIEIISPDSQPAPFPYRQYTSLTEASFRSIPPSTLTRHRIDFIRYSPDLSVLICTECRYALSSKSHLKKHLTIFHRDYVEALEDLKERLTDYDSLIIRDARDLPAIAERTYYFPELPLHFNTFKCPDCSYFSLSTKNARVHRIKVHNERASNRQKRNDIIYSLPAQILFPHQNRGLFIPRFHENHVNLETLSLSWPDTFETAEEPEQTIDTTSPTSSIVQIQPTAPDQPHTASTSRNPTTSSSISAPIYLAFRQKEADLLNKPRNGDDNDNDKTQDPRNISAFHRNSRLYQFEHSKDIPDLLTLIQDPPDPYQKLIFKKIRQATIDLQQRMSNRIPFLLRRIRQDLKSDGELDIFNRQKDFIQLMPSSRPRYFRFFADLFIFLIQLDARITEDRLQIASPTVPSSPSTTTPTPTPRNTVKSGREKNRTFLARATFSPALTKAVRALLPLGDALMREDEPDDKSTTPAQLALQDGIVEILLQLLKIKVKFTTVLMYTTFNNPATLFQVLCSIRITVDGNYSFRNGAELVKTGRQLIYGTRLVFIGIIERYERQIQGLTYGPMDEGRLEPFYQQHRGLLQLSAHNYLAEAIANLRYMTALLKQEISTNRPVIDVERDVYLIYGEKYSLAGIRGLVQDIFHQLKTIFWSRLIFLRPQDLLELPLQNCQDSAMNASRNYYLADDPALSAQSGLQNKLLEQPNSYIAKKFIKAYDPVDNRPIWRKTTVARFYTARKKFIDLLLLAVHITGGSPLRGTELVLLLFRNTEPANNSVRHLVWDREAGLVRITTHWYKSQNISRVDKSNIRFLPPTLSYLLVYYLVYVHPLYSYLNIEYLGLTDVATMLFEDRNTLYKSANLSRIFMLKSALHFRTGLALNSWRHLINHILRKSINGANDMIDDYGSDEDEEDRIDDALIDRQANRSSRSGALYYSLQQDLPSHVTNDMYFRTRKFSRSYFALLEVDKLDFSHTKASHLIDKSGSIKSRVNPPMTKPQPISRPQDLAHIQDIVTSNHGIKIDLDGAVARFFDNPRAQFRDSYQRSAVTTLLEGFTFLTYINKTGSGKSLLYLLPASLRDAKRVAMVFTPRISLRNDLLDRAQRAKIRTVNFADITADKLEEGKLFIADLVFVSIDSVIKPTLTTYIELLKKQGYQITMFLDEAHLILLENNFRHVLKYVNSLVKFRLPIVFLSATLPPSLLRLLEQEFFIQGHNTVIRGPTLRGNIVYRVEQEDRMLSRADNIRKVITQMQELGLGPTEKAVIFIAHIVSGKELATELGLSFYYAANEEKEEILATFLTDPTCQIILATSSLAVGVDFDIIKFTLHVPPYFEMINFIQESGRIRREGTAFILTPPIGEQKRLSISEKFHTSDHAQVNNLEDFRKFDKLALERLVIESRCYRRILNLFLDNDDITDCLAHRIKVDVDIRLCQLCESRQQDLDRAARDEEAAVRDVQVGLTSFEDKLYGFDTNTCLYCLFFGPISAIMSHSIKKCPEFAKSESEVDRQIPEIITGMQRTIKTEKRLQPRSCCFSCLLPPRICNRLKENNEMTIRDDCVYPELAFTILIILYLVAATPSFLSFDLTELRQKVRGAGSMHPGINYLLSPTKLYSTDSIKLFEYVNELDVEKIISERAGNESSDSSDGDISSSDEEDGSEQYQLPSVPNVQARPLDTLDHASSSKRSRSDSMMKSPQRKVQRLTMREIREAGQNAARRP